MQSSSYAVTRKIFQLLLVFVKKMLMYVLFYYTLYACCIMRGSMKRGHMCSYKFAPYEVDFNDWGQITKFTFYFLPPKFVISGRLTIGHASRDRSVGGCGAIFKGAAYDRSGGTCVIYSIINSLYLAQ